MEKNKLMEILNKHKMWLDSIEGGESANLRGVNLNGANLKGANLSGADLRYANLSSADLSYTNLRGANLSGANLLGTNLSGAFLSGSDLSYVNLKSAFLSGSDLSYANLKSADLSYANLSGVNLRGADLSYANLSGANLSGVNVENIKYNEATSFFASQCPEEGSFIAYKQCNDNLIVKLLITEDAKRSSATTRKCRASKAKVLGITNMLNTGTFEQAISEYDRSFVYKVGETVEVENFDMNRWNECSSGIHFFMTRQEAVNY